MALTIFENKQNQFIYPTLSLLSHTMPTSASKKSALVLQSVTNSSALNQSSKINKRLKIVKPLSQALDAKSNTITAGTGKFSNVLLNYYHICPKVLGGGAQGIVRKCIDLSTRKQRALKTVQKSNSPAQLVYLQREVTILKEMNHNHIIELVSVHEESESLHIVTHLCLGGELFDKIVKKTTDVNNPFPCFAENEALRTLFQIIDAVLYMHNRDIAHRDIKPENILFETAHEASPLKIVDFGLARKHIPDQNMNTLVGTPAYMAPEILTRKGYSKSCDLYSIGVIAHILFCGYLPFDGSDDESTLKAILKGDHCSAVSKSKEWKHISVSALSLLRWLLQPEPSKRIRAQEALSHPWFANNESFDANLLLSVQRNQFVDHR